MSRNDPFAPPQDRSPKQRWTADDQRAAFAPLLVGNFLGAVLLIAVWLLFASN